MTPTSHRQSQSSMRSGCGSSTSTSAPWTPLRRVDARDKPASDGILLVAASGNEGGPVDWPAALLQPSAGGESYGLAVGATNVAGSHASFSNFGQHLSL